MQRRIRTPGSRAVLVLCCVILVFISQASLEPAPQAHAASSCDLYQLHRNDRSIWEYTGSGWYQVDGNPQTWYIVARGAYLYQMHSNRSIWQYTGGCGFARSWTELDDNPLSIGLAVGIQGQLYQIHTDGSIWDYTGPSTGVGGFHQWAELSNDGNNLLIAAGSAGGLFRYRAGGGIWQYNLGTANSWTQITNPDPSSTQSYPYAFQLTTNGYNTQYLILYERGDDGSVWKYTGGGASGWTQIEGQSFYPYDTETVELAASGRALYQMLGNGSIWQWAGGTNWNEIDTNRATIDIEAGLNGDLYQLHRDGGIWMYNSSLGNWTQIDTNPVTSNLAAPEYL